MLPSGASDSLMRNFARFGDVAKVSSSLLFALFQASVLIGEARLNGAGSVFGLSLGGDFSKSSSSSLVLFATLSCSLLSGSTSIFVTVGGSVSLELSINCRAAWAVTVASSGYSCFALGISLRSLSSSSVPTSDDSPSDL